jgi:hypothetical protein
MDGNTMSPDGTDAPAAEQTIASRLIHLTASRASLRSLLAEAEADLAKSPLFARVEYCRRSLARCDTLIDRALHRAEAEALMDGDQVEALIDEIERDEHAADLTAEEIVEQAEHEVAELAQGGVAVALGAVPAESPVKLPFPGTPDDGPHPDAGLPLGNFLDPIEPPKSGTWEIHEAEGDVRVRWSVPDGAGFWRYADLYPWPADRWGRDQAKARRDDLIARGVGPEAFDSMVVGKGGERQTHLATDAPAATFHPTGSLDQETADRPAPAPAAGSLSAGSLSADSLFVDTDWDGHA